MEAPVDYSIRSDGLNATDREGGSFKVSANLRPFRDLVELDVQCRANRVEKRFPLNILLDFGEDFIEIEANPGLVGKVFGKNYDSSPKKIIRLRLNVKYCYVRYYTSAIKFDRSSMYQCRVSNGKVRIETQTKLTNERRSELKAGLGAGVSAGASGLNGKATAEVRAGLQRSVGATAERKINSIQEVYQVEVQPNGWRVGDLEFGDPYTSRGFLDGRYFEPSESAPSHTCEAEFEDGYDVATVTFKVEAHDGLSVQRIDGTDSPADERSAAISAMRDRLAAIRVERSLASNSGPISLQTLTCDVVRAAHQETPANLALPAPAGCNLDTPEEKAVLDKPRRRRR